MSSPLKPRADGLCPVCLDRLADEQDGLICRVCMMEAIGSHSMPPRTLFKKGTEMIGRPQLDSLPLAGTPLDMRELEEEKDD